MSEDPSVNFSPEDMLESNRDQKKSLSSGKQFHNYLHSDMPDREENISF